jgi:hypothetical protein
MYSCNYHVVMKLCLWHEYCHSLAYKNLRWIVLYQENKKEKF